MATGSASSAMERHTGSRPKVLFIDAYDSFTNNIISMLEQTLGVTVQTVKIDDAVLRQDLSLFHRLVYYYDAVIAGPGPGNPTNPDDVGIMNELWKMRDGELRPVLGICLGFQSLALHFGAKIDRLQRPKHGMVSTVAHGGNSIFHNVGHVRVTRYHSLEVKLDPPSDHAHEEDYGLWDARLLWEPRPAIPDLQPLAWVVGEHGDDAVLMAVQHVSKPLWGLQYHPESVCSNKQSLAVIKNWWFEVVKWHSRNPREPRPKESPLSNPRLNPLQPGSDLLEPELQYRLQAESSWMQRGWSHQLSNLQTRRTLLSRAVPLGNRSFGAIRKGLNIGYDGSEVVVLDSALLQGDTGRYSIVGFIPPEDNVRLEYRADARHVDEIRRRGGHVERRTHSLADFNYDIWQYLHRYMEERRIHQGIAASPFWGGLIGYVSYELCLDSIKLSPPPVANVTTAGKGQPDLIFAFIERSLVLDLRARLIYVQSIRPRDDTWADNLAKKLEVVVSSPSPTETLSARMSGSESKPTFTYRDGDVDVYSFPAGHELGVLRRDVYTDKVRQCQKLIRDGESYELCLTNQATLKVPRLRWRGYPWAAYLRMQSQNPAPFGAYFNVGSTTILSCSPERFLRWSRNGTCQMRPIKGTVSKEVARTRKKAEKLLSDPKEQAENLMIVDLIRHDMHGVLGSGAVSVKSLMKVEEYRRVFQLVSVIEGRYLQRSNLSGFSQQAQLLMNDRERFKQGYRLLAASLPPGSMTGAPKKRSCQLLRKLEGGQRRGIYSGVFGYMCVGGGGDFSVMIRSGFRWAEDEGVEWPTAPGECGATSGPARNAALAAASNRRGKWDRTDEAAPQPDISALQRDQDKKSTEESPPNTTLQEDKEKRSTKEPQPDVPLEQAQDNKSTGDVQPKFSGPYDYWRFGAGGAVTALSDPGAEYEEMHVKLSSTLKPFLECITGLYAFKHRKGQEFEFTAR